MPKVSSETPLVACVMLVNGRPEMVRRAVESFRAQMYERKRLYVYDTGALPCTDSLPDGFPDFNIMYHRGLNRCESIGKLRNAANWWGARPTAMDSPDAEVIAHWDSDDLSHPQRLAEQVALLQSSGAEAVGYNEALFWHESALNDQHPMWDRTDRPGEAWIYSKMTRWDVVGASLCYWRQTWEQVPFQDTNQGEDVAFWKRVDSMGVSGIGDGLPRIICAIHSDSTTKGTPVPNSPQWRRAPEYDEYCRDKMRLEGKA